MRSLHPVVLTLLFTAGGSCEAGPRRATHGGIADGAAATPDTAGRPEPDAAGDALDPRVADAAGEPCFAPRLDSGALQAVAGHSATALDDGTVMVVGGLRWGTFPGAGLSPLATRYDPVADRWCALPAPPTARAEHTATALDDGRVLFSGGITAPDGDLAALAPLATSTFWSPAVGGWSVGPGLAAARSRHTAVGLEDGGVLVIGGMDAQGVPLTSVERWHLGATEFATVQPAPIAMVAAAAVPLAGGDILVVAGCAASATYRYSPQADTWTALAAPGHVGCFGATATSLRDGRALVTGDFGYASDHSAQGRAFVYDPADDGWSETGATGSLRFGHAAARLDDGRVALFGGQGYYGFKVDVEVFDPSTSTWTAAEPALVATDVATATAVPSGVLLLGAWAPYVERAPVWRGAPSR